MKREFSQIQWDAQLEDDCRQIVRLAVREDLGRGFDLTTVALVADTVRSSAALIARQAGVVAGIRAIDIVLDEMQIDVRWESEVDDGSNVEGATCLGEFEGSARDLLTAERLILNLVARLSGIATLTHRYVESIAGTTARIYDTRKTTPGWRRLEKYAVKCGGGWNHRTGLFDAVLIKDNHLAVLASAGDHSASRLPDAVTAARRFADGAAPTSAVSGGIPVEIEVDTLDQLREVLPDGPDIVLLDNMSAQELRDAVRFRNETNRDVELEASGGITLETVREIAETGVERISVGALTHSAVSLDVGLDWPNAASP